MYKRQWKQIFARTDGDGLDPFLHCSISIEIYSNGILRVYKAQDSVLIFPVHLLSRKLWVCDPHFPSPVLPAPIFSLAFFLSLSLALSLPVPSSALEAGVRGVPAIE